MIFELSKSGNPLFREIHPLLACLLRTIVEDPWERYPEGSTRLLPPPGDNEEICLDWQDHVQPDLRRHFDSERTAVERDLEAMKQGNGKKTPFTLEIPRQNVDAWLVTLNVIRLALSTEFQLGETELNGLRTSDSPPDLTTARGLALVQVNLFAFMQECIISSMDGYVDDTEMG